jgi:mono/diheme cytochrome c family protein
MRVAISAVFLTFAVTSACADATNGERLAQRWCAPCHATPGHSGSAPAMTAIARNHEYTREQLAVIIVLFHPKMPDMTLTHDEASDLAEYITKLSQAK